MMKTLLSYLFSLILTHALSQSEKISVFTSGTEGHKTYRIPAIIRSSQNSLLAFCEGRVNGAGDYGDINIVMKRSEDGGRSWGAIQTVVDYESLQAGNPAPVMDYTDPDFPNGRLFLFYNTGNNHENEIRKGNGLREVWYVTSTDEGHTWSEPVNITIQTHRPNYTRQNRVYRSIEDWRSYANTPGHAMQFSTGKYKGRIFVAANHSEGAPQPDFQDYKAHGFYTDDHGQTFRLSENLTIAGSNESMATELANDKLMMNTRNQRGDMRQRIISISSNGGQSWDTTYFDNNLPDPVCQGSIITIHKKKNIIAFCNAADSEKRNNLTLRISYDGGATWRKSWIIDHDQFYKEGDYTAYSDLVLLSKKAIGVLYERANYKEIVFVTHFWK